jgi:hypothetical protein
MIMIMYFIVMGFGWCCASKTNEMGFGESVCVCVTGGRIVAAGAAARGKRVGHEEQKEKKKLTSSLLVLSLIVYAYVCMYE